MEKQTFFYSTSSGKSGTSTLRLKAVKTSELASALALQFEQLTSGPTKELVVEGKNGAKITVARMLECGGLMAEKYRYGLIYEGARPQCYAVFYASELGQITWIAGPKGITFERAWREFREGLQ